MSRSYPRFPRAYGRALTLMALELGLRRRGWEHVPLLGDWLLRKRIRRERLGPAAHGRHLSR